jgi:hypothetical protein
MSAALKHPSLGIAVTASVREGLRIVMFGVPCPTCGRVDQSLTAKRVAEDTGVSEATLSRFLAGRAISSDVLDRLYEFVNVRLPKAPA